MLKLLFVVCNARCTHQYYLTPRHLNTTFIGLDGCFKPKLKDCGIVDPDLGTGLAYMVNDTKYAAHLKATADTATDKPVSWHAMPHFRTHAYLL